MNCDDILENYVVRIDSYAETGSGFIFYYANEGIYIITAEHCLYQDPTLKKRNELNIENISIKYKKNYPKTNFIKMKPCKIIFSEEVSDDICIIKVSKEELIKHSLDFQTPIPIRFLNKRFKKKEYRFRGYPNSTKSKNAISLKGTDNHIPDDNIRFELSIENLSESTSGEPVYNFFKGFSGSGVFIEENGNLYLVGIQKSLPSPDGDFNLIICHGIENLKQLMHKELVAIKYSFLPDFDFISYENLNYVNMPPRGIKLPGGTKINNSTDYIYDRPELNNINTLIENHQTLIFVTGEAGSGKSSVLNSLADQLFTKYKVLFIQCRKYISINNLESLINEIYPYRENANDFYLQIKRITEKLIVIIDSLDVISWNPNKLKAFIEFIEKFRELYNISIIISCRTFDLAYNADLKIYEPYSKRINIGNLPTPEIEKIFFLLNITLPIDLKKRELILTFFSLPIRLQILFQVYNQISDIQDISTDLKLHEALWSKLTQNVAGTSYDDIEKHIFVLVKMMISQEKLDINLDQFRNENNFNSKVNEKLISNGLLKKSEDEISITFFHQTFFDYVAVRYLASNKNILAFISENQEKFFFLPTIRYYLRFLRTRDTNFLNVINTLIENRDYDIIVKLNVVRFVAELKEPNLNEIQIVLDLLHKELYDKIFFRLANENWFFVLYNKNKFAKLTKNQIYSFLLYANRIDFEDENILIGTIEVIASHKLESYEQSELIKLLNKLKPAKLNLIFDKIYKFIKSDLRSNSNDLNEVLEKAIPSFPELVLTIILENFKEDFSLYDDEKKMIRRILSDFPNCVTLIIDFFENYERGERKIRRSYFSDENQDEGIETEKGKLKHDFYIYDTCCLWDDDKKTFYSDLEHGRVKLLIYLIDITLNELANTDAQKYRVLFNEITKSNYESLNRIAFLSALNKKKKKLYIPFLLNKKSYFATTIDYYIKENLFMIWEQISDEEKVSFSKVILECYKEANNKLPVGKEYLATIFLLEFRFSFKKIKYPKLLEKPFEEASMIYRNHLTSNNMNFTEEQFQIDLQPRLGGITDVQRGSSSFSVQELEESGDEEKISLFKNYLERDKLSNLAYWWVENGRRLAEGFSKNPKEYLSIVDTILADDTLFRFRSFLMIGIREYEKNAERDATDLKSKLTQEEIAKISLRILSENDSMKDDLEISDIEKEFMGWVSDFYQNIPIQYRGSIRKKVVKIFYRNQRKHILDYDNKYLTPFKSFLNLFSFYIIKIHTYINYNPLDYKEDYYGKAINSVTGLALEAMAKIVYYEIKSNIEKLIFIKEGKSLNYAHRAIVGSTLQNLKNNFPKDCLKLIDYWTSKKDFLSLKFGIKYFDFYKESEIPVILKYIEKWLPFFEIEVQIYENLHNHSFTSNCIYLIIQLASRGIAKACLILSSLIKSQEDFSTKYKNILLFHLVKSLTINTNHHLLTFLHEFSELADANLRGQFIYRVCNIEQGFISDKDRRKLILKALKVGNVSNELVSHSLGISIKELYLEDYIWTIEICKEIFLYKKILGIATYELENFGIVLVDLYLRASEYRTEISKMINVLIITGWEKGLNDIYGLGR